MATADRQSLGPPEVAPYGVDPALIKPVPKLTTLVSGAVAIAPVCHWWSAAKKMLAVPDFGPLEVVGYRCPWSDRDFSFCVPSFVVFYDLAVAELATQEPMHRDVEWMLGDMDYHSEEDAQTNDVDRALLGHGYTATLMPGDGIPCFAKNSIAVEGGLMVCTHHVWLSREVH